MNALKSGKVNMSQDKDVSFNVSGLDPEKAYDLYYVAQDKAGNYSARVQVITTIPWTQRPHRGPGVYPLQRGRIGDALSGHRYPAGVQ